VRLGDGHLELIMWEVTRMKALLSDRSRSCRGARHPVFYGLLALVSIGAATATAQSGAALVERLDSLAGAGVREDRSVGLVAAVVKGNDTLLLEAYGKADVEGDVQATVDTVFPIGSDTKQFTAAAILQLRDQGRLGLDDDITKWLPDFETRGNKVTLRHLLGHTSGVTDLVEMPELRAMQLMRNPTVTREDVYKVISRYAFMFPTGTMQLYSNSNFWLLGLVVEKASGMTYEDYVEKEIFEPLGMTRSMYCNNSEDTPRRAYGHGLRNGIVRTRDPDRAHGDLRRRRHLLDGGGPDHMAAGTARRHSADATVVHRDDDAVEAQRRDVPPLLDGTLRGGG
jgi:CubicO group peptidase (beta-lactamase class C family)